MSQTQIKPAKISVKNNNPGSISTGANTVIELNGQKLPGVTFLKIEIKPKNIAKVTLEMIVDIDCLELDADMKLVSQKPDVRMVPVLSKFESQILK